MCGYTVCFGHLVKSGNDPFGGIVWRGRCLEIARRLVVPGDHEIGEGAADVDSYSVHWPLLLIHALGTILSGTGRVRGVHQYPIPYTPSTIGGRFPLAGETAS